MHLYLIGYMGSGKSYWGPRFAEALGRPFWDLDAWVEGRAGCTISELFEREGEEGFRLREAEALGEVARSREGGVVACGGGTPCWPGNWEVMKSTGRTMWLRVDAEVLMGRLAGTGWGRPLLPGNGRDGEALRAHLAERSACYGRAQWIWDGPGEAGWPEALRWVRKELVKGVGGVD